VTADMPDAVWTRFDYAVVDVEGNGQQPPDLVEAAIVPISAGRVGDPRTWLVKPPRPITAMARRFHKISDADVADCPSVSTVADGIRLAMAERIFVAHNAHVDLGVLTRELPGFEPIEVIDTLALTKRLAPGRMSYRLSSLVQAFGLAEGLPSGLQPHRAGYDALVAARLLTRLASPPDRDPLTLADLRARRPSKSPAQRGDEDGETEALF
jgi:exodeoxyribonuclease X